MHLAVTHRFPINGLEYRDGTVSVQSGPYRNVVRMSRETRPFKVPGQRQPLLRMVTLPDHLHHFDVDDNKSEELPQREAPHKKGHRRGNGRKA